MRKSGSGSDAMNAWPRAAPGSTQSSSATTGTMMVSRDLALNATTS
jgi:hypothetical protein